MIPASGVYRGIREEFDDRFIEHFFTPLIEASGEGAFVIEASGDFIRMNCDKADRTEDDFKSDANAAALRITHPICGQYKLWFKYSVNSLGKNSDLFDIYDTQVIPKPDAIATLENYLKLRMWFERSTDEVEVDYYDTSNTQIAVDSNNSVTKETWYIIYLEKTLLYYFITIFNSDMTLLSGPTRIPLSEVNNGDNPDYLVWGTLANDDHNIDLFVDVIDIKFDLLETNYSNDKHHFNSKHIGGAL